MYSRFIMLLLAFITCLLSLSVGAFSQTLPLASDTLPPAPYFVEMTGEEHTSERHFVNRRRLWARLTVANPALTPFILRVTFNNRGALMSWRGNAAGRTDALIHLQDFELRYKNMGEAYLTKKFSDIVGKSDGYVYEIEFLPEDMQPVYNMELWSLLYERDAVGAVPGLYQEVARFEIVEKTPVFRSQAVSDTTLEVEPEGEGLGKRGRRLWRRR